MRSILVTGAAGFIGTAVREAANVRGLTVWPVVHRPSGLPDEIIADLEDLSFGRRVSEFPRVDAVVHLGARIEWGGVPRDDLLAPNVVATGLLAAWASRISAQFVYASTAIVCGIRASRIDSTTPPNPDSDYGYSKWLGEEMVRMSGVDGTILRIAGVFGPDGSFHLGLNRAIAGALRGERPVLVGEGQGRRNYIYVHDVARCIVTCVEQGIHGTHLAAGPSALAIAEMLQIVCDEFLAGAAPDRRPGDAGHDQIVVQSPALPASRDFRDAVKDIARRARLCV